MKKHEIDTLSFIRSIRDSQYEQLKDKSTAERIEFYRKKAKSLYTKLGKVVEIESTMQVPEA